MNKLLQISIIACALYHTTNPVLAQSSKVYKQQEFENTKGSPDTIIRWCKDDSDETRYASENLKLPGYHPCGQVLAVSPGDSDRLGSDSARVDSLGEFPSAPQPDTLTQQGTSTYGATPPTTGQQPSPSSEEMTPEEQEKLRQKLEQMKKELEQKIGDYNNTLRQLQ